MFKKNCFAYREVGPQKYCSALLKISCCKCKFYKTQEEYDKYVASLKHKKSGGVICQKKKCKH